jgi:hypothetical protein
MTIRFAGIVGPFSRPLFYRDSAHSDLRSRAKATR